MDSVTLASFVCDFALDDAVVRDWPREVFIELATDARIRYCRSEHHERPIRYAITLESLLDGEWSTVCLWDNADAPSEHHEHRYNRASGKLAPRLLPHRSSNKAMNNAIDTATLDWRRIVARWEGSE